MRDFEEARALMVARQMARRGIVDARVLDAARHLDREHFLPEDLADCAYDDVPLPIGEGQTISQPYVVALMAQAAAILPTDRMLEVGTGSGYAAALLGMLGARVCSVERLPGLAEAARRRLAARGHAGVSVRTGDGSQGWPDEAPFDVIVVSAGAPAVPDALRAQLALGGRLVLPLGGRDEQRLTRITRRGADRFDEEDLGVVLFVPLIGAQAWPDAGAVVREPTSRSAAFLDGPEAGDADRTSSTDRGGFP